MGAVVSGPLGRARASARFAAGLGFLGGWVAGLASAGTYTNPWAALAVLALPAAVLVWSVAAGLGTLGRTDA